MNPQKVASILLLVGVAAMVASFVIGLPGLYQTPDLQKRVQIIEESKARWNISQSLIGLSLLLLAAGYALLALHLRTMTAGWLPVLGVGIFAVGMATGTYFLYRQTVDPLSSYQGDFTPFEMVTYWLSLAGLLLLGIAFLGVNLPGWLGYVTAGATIIYAIFFLVSGIGYPTPGLVTILSLLIAIVLLRQ